MRRVAIASLLVVSGCASLAQPETPAVVVEPTGESRAELSKVVASALGRTDVTLADDALTSSNVLMIERKVARDAMGQRLSGRDYERPETFELVTDGERCTLLHRSSQQRFELKRTQCRALNASSHTR